MSSRKLNDWISSFVKYTDPTEPPSNFRRWVAISAIGGALRRKVRIPYGDYITWYPNMYIVLVGPAGSRKTTAMSSVENFIRNAGIRLATDSSTHAALIQELQDSAFESYEVSPSDYASNLTIFSKEFGVFLGKQGSNEELITQITDWFDCPSDWTRKTKTQGTFELQNIFINILGATTPSYIKDSLTMSAIGGGLTSRIIFVYSQGKPKRISRPRLIKGNDKLKAKLQHDFDLISGLKGEMKLSDSFNEVYDNWYVNEDSKNEFQGDPFLDGYSSRRAMHLVKLSSILSASENNNMIVTADHFNRAKLYLENVEKDLRSVFQGVGRSGNSQVTFDIENHIKYNGYVNLRDLLKRFINDVKDLEELKNILNKLVMVKKIVVLQNKDNPILKVYYHSDNAETLEQIVKEENKE